MARGRPKGSKNKSKEIKETSSEIKRIKKEIKDLRAEKLRLPSGSEKRIELHREIKRLKQLLKEQKADKADIEVKTIQNNTEKEPLVIEILSLQDRYKITPTFESIGIDLYKYSVEHLQCHIGYIKRKNLDR
jgi:hypothetical protein